MMKKTCLFVLGCSLSFLFIEGFSSTVHVAREILSEPRRLGFASQRLYTRYDRDLGWTSLPYYYQKDFYGPGVYLKTNSRGFRNDEDIDVSVPPGHIRVICSGDSFTFGYGVDNDHTWCQLLNSIDHRFQPVNMGQAGYGVDQAYLWYRRDGASLDHDVHILAFITDDFRRMKLRLFFGYGKPFLEVKNGGIVVDNVPVPKANSLSSFYRWCTLHGDDIQDLRSVEVLGSALKRIVGSHKDSGTAPPMSDRMLLDKLIAELDSLNNQKNSRLVLVYLPTKPDYSDDHLSAPWRKFLKEEAQNRQLLFVDLVEDFRKLPLSQVQKMFICADSLQGFSAARGHLTDDGNAYVARAIYEKLTSNVGISQKLASLSVRPETASYHPPQDSTRLGIMDSGSR